MRERERERDRRERKGERGRNSEGECLIDINSSCLNTDISNKIFNNNILRPFYGSMEQWSFEKWVS